MYRVSHDPAERNNILEDNEHIPRYCGRFGFVSMEDGREIQAYCKRWDCAVCGRIKAFQLKDKIEALTHEKRLKMMLTLTTDPRKARELYPNMSVNQYVTYTWDKTRRGLRYHWPEVGYLWMKEYHKERSAVTGELKNPYPHMHILVTDDLREEDEQKVRRLHCKAGGGNQVDLLEAEDSNEVRRYITKYITKTAQDTAHGQVGRGRIWGRSKDMRTFDELAKADVCRDAQPSSWVFVKEYLFKGIIGLDKWGNLCYTEREPVEQWSSNEWLKLHFR